MKRIIPALALMGLFACADLGPYVWADALPPPPASQAGEYLLAAGDTILVRVYNQESVSGRVRVRPDGFITVPFVNDVPAAGRSTRDLAATLQTRLRDYLNQPVVTVSLEEMGQTRLSVLGEVARPGVYQVERGQGLLRALAAAGGLTEFAHKDRIFVVRAAAGQRIRFTLDGLARPDSRAARFGLQDDDVVLVQ
jgi:polysaccharide export outer membrane protein